MKKRAYSFDIVENTLTLSANFIETINDPTSAEYKLVKKFQHDFPNLTIVRRTHKTPTCYQNSDGTKTKRQKNRGLTYERMEAFMGALPNGKDYSAAYKELREKAESMCTSPYTVVNKWFRKQFPDFHEKPFDYLDNPPEIIDFSGTLTEGKPKSARDMIETEKEVS